MLQSSDFKEKFRETVRFVMFSFMSWTQNWFLLSRNLFVYKWRTGRSTFSRKKSKYQWTVIIGVRSRSVRRKKCLENELKLIASMKYILTWEKGKNTSKIFVQKAWETKGFLMEPNFKLKFEIMEIFGELKWGQWGQNGGQIWNLHKISRKILFRWLSPWLCKTP